MHRVTQVRRQMAGFREYAEAEGSKKAPTSGSTKQLAGLGRAVGIWSRASGKLFSLEARIKDQVCKKLCQPAAVWVVSRVVMLQQTNSQLQAGLPARYAVRPC